MIIPRKNFARIRTNTWVYYDACQRGYVDFLNLTEKIVPHSAEEYVHDEEQDDVRWRCNIAGLQTVIFSAMCFEAAVFEYAADRLGDAYVRDHLDKLDVLSKWVIALRLVAGFELRKDRAPYAAFKQTVVARNQLVHSKSEPMDFINLDRQIEKLEIESKKHTDSIHTAYRALLLMSLELESALGTGEHPLPSFADDRNVNLRVPPRLMPIVHECRETVKRGGGA